MALKKKGTPAKIDIVKEADLEQWKKLINDAVNDPATILIPKEKKNKKNKS